MMYILAVSQKIGDCRNQGQGCTGALKPGEYTACPNMLFDKDGMIKRHMNIHADLSVSTVCECKSSED